MAELNCGRGSSVRASKRRPRCGSQHQPCPEVLTVRHRVYREKAETFVGCRRNREVRRGDVVLRQRGGSTECRSRDMGVAYSGI
jgi:hypothetical protein